MKYNIKINIYLWLVLLIALKVSAQQLENVGQYDEARTDICDKYVEARSLSVEVNKYSGEKTEVAKFRWNSISENQGMWQDKSRWGAHFGIPYYIKVLDRNGRSIGSGDIYVCISDVKTKKALGFERLKR